MVDWHPVVLTHVVVDGSNIATEGRAVPSLRQLDEAVRQFQDEFPQAETIVVVDATFGHRIDPGELKAFEAAVAHGEMVSPPAGAIGRGDAFVLRIAERVNGQVLSNDSFQEFHEQHPWLFDPERLMGGKPVPGVGWIFTLRTPVRGPRSGTRSGTSRKRAEPAATPRAGAATRARADRAGEAARPKRAAAGPMQLCWPPWRRLRPRRPRPRPAAAPWSTRRSLPRPPAGAAPDAGGAGEGTPK